MSGRGNYTNTGSVRAAGAKSRNKGIVFFLCLASIVLLFLLVMASPFFHIAHVQISGVTVYDEPRIREKLGLSQKQSFITANSIFYRSSGSMERSLQELPYIRKASVIKVYPDTIVIRAQERVPRVSVYDERQGVYLNIDDEGYVLKISEDPGELPVMIGMKLSGYTIGETLIGDNPETASAISRLSAIIRRYGITHVAKADVSDPYDIRLFIHNVTVHIGPIDDADQKINWAITCMAKLDTGIKGDLYVQNIDDMYFEFPVTHY